MSLERRGRSYGDHTLIGDNNDGFFRQGPLDKALDLGWSDGCPVAATLTKSVENGGRGAEVMAGRYGAVNFWAGVIKDTFKKSERTDLHDQFEGMSFRREGQGVGNHDEGWIPEELRYMMIVSPELYSLPRIITTFIDGAPSAGDTKATRATYALTSLEHLTQVSENIKQLSARFAEDLAIMGGEPKKLLKALISDGKSKEDNCHTDFWVTVRNMQTYAPRLWEVYKGMDSKQRKEAGIADIKIS